MVGSQRSWGVGWDFLDGGCCVLLARRIIVSEYWRDRQSNGVTTKGCRFNMAGGDVEDAFDALLGPEDPLPGNDDEFLSSILLSVKPCRV